MFRGDKAVAMSTKLTDITKQLHRFLSSSSSSVLLQETNGISGVSIIEAHVQKRRLDNDKCGMTVLRDSSADQINCLNIVNVVVAEKNRRKGLFTDFLELLEGFDYGSYLNKSGLFYIRIDKVMNPVLDEFLPKNGYTRTLSCNEIHYSYHKAIRCITSNLSESAQQPLAGLQQASAPAAWEQHRNHEITTGGNIFLTD